MSRKNINNDVPEFIAEQLLELLDGGYQLPNTEQGLKDDLFRQLVGAPHTLVIDESVRNSPLYLALDCATDQVYRLNSAIGSLWDELRDDILDRFMTREHWDEQIMKKYIESETNLSSDPIGLDRLLGQVEDMLDNYSAPPNRD